jgi:hypothetical protein
MTSSKEFSLTGENRLRKFIGRRISSPRVFFFEGDYLPMYEETYLSLPFQEQKGKMRKKNDLCISDRQEKQKNASAISMKQGNRGELRSLFSVKLRRFPVGVEVTTLYLSGREEKKGE